MLGYLQPLWNPEIWIDFVFIENPEVYEAFFHPLIPKQFDDHDYFI